MNEEKEIRSVCKLIMLHLFPGMVLSIIYIFLLRAQVLAEYPKIVLLGVSGLISILPAELGYLFYTAKREEGDFNIFRILGLKNKMKLKEYILYTLSLFLLAGMLMTALKPISNYLLDTMIPSWYSYVQDISQFSKNAVITVILVYLFIFTLILPIVEEFYFRGYLLARMKWMGKYGVLVNVILFSVYHFWSPWLIAARIIGMLPLYYCVYKKDSLKLGIFVHCLANFTDVITYVMLL